jgi:hypothetical protein
MEKILKKLQSQNDEFWGVFSTEQTAMMKHVFDLVCQEREVQTDDHDHRETLALVILRATRARTTETGLLTMARRVVKNF